jgi:dolichol-phosphate mannosyltransferase
MLSLVIPTYNEKNNIRALIEQLDSVFKKSSIKAEIIIVDDNSPDGTGDIVENLKASYPLKIVHREKKTGLSSAVLEGFKAANGEFLGVMDADFSHSPQDVPKLLKVLESDEADLVVGSRYVKGGSIDNWPFRRRLISRVACLFARPLTTVKDATSGFFMLKKGILEGREIKTEGFKIGLEIIGKGKYSRAKEVPISFIDRKHGESKMGTKETLQYLVQLSKLYAHKLTHRR